MCECPPEEIPSVWVSPSCNEDSGARAGAAQVNRTMEPGMLSVLESGPGWQAISNPWFGGEAPEVDREEDYFYVNLLANPERFTGYEVLFDGHHELNLKAITPQPAFPFQLLCDVNRDGRIADALPCLFLIRGSTRIEYGVQSTLRAA